MNQLIEINDNNGIKTVNARDLHEFIESKREFSTWIKDRIKQYEFIENQDFTTIDKIVNRSKLIEYHISLDMAKELSMVERNQKGRDARKYFIECEKKSQVVFDDPIIAMRQEQLKLIQEQEYIKSRLDDIEKKAISVSVERNLIKEEAPIGYANKGTAAETVAKLTNTSKAIVNKAIECYSNSISTEIYKIEVMNDSQEVITNEVTSYKISDVIKAVRHAVDNSVDKTECFRIFPTLGNKSMKLQIKG